MKVKAKINPQFQKYFKNLVSETLVATADALHSDLVKNQTMPFDTGALQNRDGGVNRNGEKVRGTHIERSKKNKGVVTIISDTPYARRLYYHPEYNFQQIHNKNAGGMWFEPYKKGGKKEKFATKTFARLLKGKL